MGGNTSVIDTGNARIDVVGGSVMVGGGGSAADAFGRLRVSTPTTIFDSKQLHDNSPIWWDDQEVSGAGTGSTHSVLTASSTLTVGATTAGKRVRQTFMRFGYKPGKSQLVYMTGTLNIAGGGTGITSGFGIGDDSNGIFIENRGGVPYVIVRSNTTGSVVENAVAQSNWSEDRLDGSGNSKISLDMTKSQLLFIDYEWLSVGRVRVGFIVDGIFIHVHHFHHANLTVGAYMSTPNLPLRYWIENDGTGAASSMEAICSTVISEGENSDLGLNHFTSTDDSFINANTIGTRYAIKGIRLKTTALDGIVKIIGTALMNVTNDDYHWELLYNPAIAGTAPTWTSNADDTYESASADTVGNPSVNTVTGGHSLDGGYVKSGGNSGSISAEVETQLRLGAAIDGTRDEIWLVVMPLAAGANIYGGLNIRDVT